jgi:hypothetical protein
MGRYQAGVDEILAIEQKAKEINQPQLVVISQLLRSLAYRAGMDWQAMLGLVRPIGVLVDKMGEKAYGAIAWNLVAWALAHLGRPEEYDEVRGRARLLAKELGGKYLGSDWIAASDGEVALIAGKPEEALRIAQAVVETSKPAGLVLSWGIAERVWGVAVSRLGGTAEDSDLHMKESQRVLDLGQLALDTMQTEIWWGDICAERHQIDDALRHYQTAREYLTTAGAQYAVSLIDARLHRLTRSN